MSGGLARRTSTKPPQSARRDVVGVRRAGAEALAFERAGDQRLERRVRAEQRVHGDDRRRGARRAAAEAARQRQPLADASARRRAARRARVSSACAATPAVLLRRVARQPAAVAGDVVDAHAGVGAEARRHLVARRVEREAEHVEAARDVRHGRGRERGDTDVMSGSSVRIVGMRYSRNARSKS